MTDDLTINNTQPYEEFFGTIKKRVQQAQQAALKAVNKELISLYWDLGRLIVEKQEQYGWGENIIERLAKDLQVEYPGVRGYSVRNLRYVRSFYLTYRNTVKLQSLIAEISWTHHLKILPCATDQEREFYLKMTKKFGWSVRTLEHQIEGKSFESWLLNQTNFEQTLPKKNTRSAKLNVRDDYNFDFLTLAEPHLERELAGELVHNIEQFLTELGGYFSFIGRHFRLEISQTEYFIDLLFYNRQLQCLVAVELKTGEFKPEYGSKMNFYLSALDDMIRLQHEKPSIGIIICRTKDRTIVEYTLRDVNKPIAVATYNHYASLDTLPERISKYLPSPEEIEKRLIDLS